jgi:hypothetical protein
MALSMRINGGFKVGIEQAWYQLQMLVTQKGDSIYVKILIMHNKVMMAMFWIWRLKFVVLNGSLRFLGLLCKSDMKIM